MQTVWAYPEADRSKLWTDAYTMSDFVPDKRRGMHEARKRRIWERDGGLCWRCHEPVPMDGPEVTYDHRIGLWITLSDADESISPSHTFTCDKVKTAADQTTIAKIKRIIRKADPETRKPSQMRSRGFAKGGPKQRIQSRPFAKKRVD